MENKLQSKYLLYGGLLTAVAIICLIMYFKHANHVEEVRGFSNIATGAMQDSYNQIADMLDEVTVSIYGVTNTQLLGSGFVISKQRVLTNYHVIENITDITVKVYAPVKKEYKATVLVIDQENDLAILQVSTNTVLASSLIGDSDTVNVGDIVFSMGNSFGLGNAFSESVVCSDNQYFAVNGISYKNMIQMERSVSPGASGGPLVNIRGEVIGIVTAINDRQGDFSGIGFATPINSVLALIQKAGGF